MTSPSFLPGTLVANRFAVKRKLGEGAWGEVWLVEEPILGARYALKRSRRRLSSVDDFTLAEIESWTALPPSLNIARCYFWDIGSAQEMLILVEYVPAGSLSRWLSHGWLVTPEAILRAAVHLANALAVVHESGVIHGDLTPNNILVGTGGILKLTDFGMATADGRTEVLYAGTPEYRGYEAAHALPRTPWTDLWSFGLILIQLVTGCRFWGLGLAGPRIAAEARHRLSSQRHDAAELIEVLDVAASCFRHDWTSARAIGQRLRELYRSRFRGDLATAPPHPPSPTPQAHLRRLGTIAYGSPVSWWERAAVTFGQDSVPPRPPDTVYPRRRSAAISAERVLASLLPLYEANLTPDKAREYLRLLGDLGTVREVAGNVRGAASAYRRVVSTARRIDPLGLQFQKEKAWALVHFANIRLVTAGRKSLCLRLYDRAIKYRQQLTARELNADTSAKLAAAFLHKATACVHLQRYAEAVDLCNNALEVSQGSNPSPDDRQHTAYAHQMRSRCREQGDPLKISDLEAAVAIYSALVADGHGEHQESHAIARLNLVRARPFHSQTAPQHIVELDLVEAALAQLTESGERLDLQEHLARLLIRKSRELFLIDRNDEAVQAAERSVHLLEEGAIRLGRQDLHFELASATRWLGRLLVASGTDMARAARVLRTSVRVWEHLQRTKNDDYLQFLAAARAAYALALATSGDKTEPAARQLCLAEREVACCEQRGFRKGLDDASRLLRDARDALKDRQQESLHQ